MEDNRSDDDDDYEDYYHNEYENFQPDNDHLDQEYKNFNESVIILDKPLKFIVNNMQINVIYDDIKVNLLDYLPLFKKGYTTKNDLQIIFSISQYLNNIDPVNDPLYIKAFKGEVPNDYINYHKNYVDLLGNPPAEIILESELIEKLHDVYHLFEINDDGDILLESFINHMNTIQGYEWVNFLTFSKLELYTIIILDYEFAVEEAFNKIDPRDKNNKAYHLAVKYGNKEIIELIKKRIIELNWLEKQALIKEFNKYDFLSDDIIRYYQSKKY